MKTSLWLNDLTSLFLLKEPGAEHRCWDRVAWIEWKRYEPFLCVSCGRQLRDFTCPECSAPHTIYLGLAQVRFVGLLPGSSLFELVDGVHFDVTHNKCGHRRDEYESEDVILRLRNCIVQKMGMRDVTIFSPDDAGRMEIYVDVTAGVILRLEEKREN